MQTVAQAWLVYRLTDSSFMLGLVSFCTLIPVFLFSLFAGVLADRYNRRRMLLIATVSGMAHALLLAYLTLSGQVQPWHIVILALLIGCVHAIETPARYSFMADLVPRSELSNAIALNSSAFNIARFVGPPVAGLLIAFRGEGFVFLVNGASYMAVLFAYLSMRLELRKVQVPGGRMMQEIVQALHYARKHIHIRAALALVGTGSMVGASVSVLMPVFSREVYGGEATVMGYLLGAMGAGALAGALSLAHRSSNRHIDRLMGYAGMTTGVILLFFSLNQHLPLAIVLLFVSGFSQTTLAASTNTLIQLCTPDHLRGRIMSLYSMIFIGLMPAGALLAGLVAQTIGAPHTVMIFATACFLISALFLWYVPRFNGTGESPERTG